MDFEHRKHDFGSFDRPPEGRYFGVVVGFADVGVQPGGAYKASHKVMVRLELHKRKGPAVDSEGRILTITHLFTAAISDKSNLFKFCAAIGIDVSVGAKFKSRDFKHRVCIVDVEHNGEYANLDDFIGLDPDEDVPPSPVLEFEHWEPSDGGHGPVWASWALARSIDPEYRKFATQPKKLADLDEPTAPAPAASMPPRPSRAATTPARPAVVVDDDDDIPF